MRRFLSYLKAAAGPIGSAGAQFLLSLLLLRSTTSEAFGVFSFLLLAAQLSLGVWGALFCAPLPVLLARADEPTRNSVLRCMSTTNLFAAAAIGVGFFALAKWMNLQVLSGAVFAGFSSLALVRWFARARAYALGCPGRAMASDLAYAATLFLVTATLTLLPAIDLTAAFGALLASTAVGMLFVYHLGLRAQLEGLHPRNLRGYGAIWRAHSRWSLVGVFSTEATANAHAYVVTLAYGPSAYAPIAASALLIRPLNVAMNALSEFERPRMARQLGEGRRRQAGSSSRWFLLALILAWLLTLATSVAMLELTPQWLLPPQYDARVLMLGGALWMIVTLVRLMRVPSSVLLQAGGSFRPLAMASVYACGISVVAVIAILALGSPVWSIGGILVGEAVFAILVWNLARGFTKG